MKRILKIVSVIIATLIGAGFASGQEIKVFFYSYGIKGLFGLVSCSILFAFVIYKVLKMSKINNIETYKDFVYILVGRASSKKYLNVSFIINTIVNLFLMITFFIMLAGFGAYFSQEMGVSSYIGSGILASLCFITLMSNVNGVVKVSSYLVPILVVFILIIGGINITSINLYQTINELTNVNSYGWLLSSVLYCSYNSILLIPVLITLKKYIKSDRDISISALISGGLIFILAIAIYFLLSRVNIDIETLEMPIVYVISNFFTWFKIIYAFIILSSIYTTAISIGVSFLENISKNKKSYTLIGLSICIIGFIVSGFGFSNLVTLLYPIFGYLGVIQIGALMFRYAGKSGSE